MRRFDVPSPLLASDISYAVSLLRARGRSYLWWGKKFDGTVVPLHKDFVEENFSGDEWRSSTFSRDNASAPTITWVEDEAVEGAGSWKTTISSACFHSIPPGNPRTKSSETAEESVAFERPPLHFPQYDRRLCTLNSLRSCVKASCADAIALPCPSLTRARFVCR